MGGRLSHFIGEMVLAYRVSPDIAVVVLFTTMAAGLMLTGEDPPLVRTLLALPLVLVLPGYAVIAAVFPRYALGESERLLLSLGVSLTIAIVGGLALHLTPWGLNADSWAVLLGSVTLSASAVAFGRRPLTLPGRPASGLGVNQWLLMGVAALIVTAVMTLTHAATQNRTGLTQLWLLPVGESDPDAVRLGIRSMELTRMRYRLQLEGGSHVIETWSPLELNPDEEWETIVTLPAGWQSDGHRLEAVLYRLDAPGESYRRVGLWRGE